jgi:hypothetical protein
MVAARFEIPKGELDARKSVRVIFTELDGTVSEFTR